MTKSKASSSQLRGAYAMLSRASGIEPGDTVRVVSKADNDRLMGWDNCWDSCMDKFVGRTFNVTSVRDTEGFTLGSTGYMFPFYSLEIIEKRYTIEIDGKTISMSAESYQALKDSLID